MAAPEWGKDRNLSEWQHRLLPLMSATLVGLTLFGCAANVIETYSVLKHIDTYHEINLEPAMNMLESNVANLSPTDRFAYVRWKTLSMLEVNTIESRYHQASIAVMTRVYIVFLGFATGMVLALVGAAFILGKLREANTTVSGNGGGIGALSISTASPGLILAFFGTVLMVFTIASRADVSVTDRSLYVPEPMVSESPAVSAPARPGPFSQELRERGQDIKAKVPAAKQ